MQGKGHNWVESMTIAKGCKVGFRCKVELATIMTQLGVGWLLILVACIVAKQPTHKLLPKTHIEFLHLLATLRQHCKKFVDTKVHIFFQHNHELHVVEQVWPSITYPWRVQNEVFATSPCTLLSMVNVNMWSHWGAILNPVTRNRKMSSFDNHPYLTIDLWQLRSSHISMKSQFSWTITCSSELVNTNKCPLNFFWSKWVEN